MTSFKKTATVFVSVFSCFMAINSANAQCATQGPVACIPEELQSGNGCVYGGDIFAPNGNPYMRNHYYYPGYYHEYNGYFTYPKHHFCNNYHRPIPYYRHFESKYGIFDENRELYRPVTR